MGNCMEVLEPRKEEKQGNHEEERGIRIKMLVTKRELEVLVMELKKGEKRIEDILVEMGEERDKREKKAKLQIGWKPKLENIEENNEVNEFFN